MNATLAAWRVQRKTTFGVSASSHDWLMRRSIHDWRDHSSSFGKSSAGYHG